MNGMLTLLAAGLLLKVDAQTVTLVPTDDIWVYGRASDPAHDSFLRVWGADGKAVAPTADDVDSYSYAYLKFSLASVPRGKVVTANLIVTSIANPGFTEDYIKGNPLEARALAADFTEKTWDFERVRTLSPSADGKAVYGATAPQKWPQDKPFPIVIDLLKGPGDFRAAIEGASGKDLGIALTSTDDVEASGRAGIYKVYSKEADNAQYRPSLQLTIEH